MSARPHVQWWRTARLRRNNRALRDLLGRFVAELSKWTSAGASLEGDAPELFRLTEEARRLSATRDGGA